MPRFHLSKTADAGATVSITGSDAKHIRNVLRVAPGETLHLFDSAGFDYRAVVAALSSERVDLRVKERFPSKTESPLRIVLAQAMLKDRKFDEIIRQVTELGVSEFICFPAHRSVSRPDPQRLSARIRRWEKIAAEALKQCGRHRAPEIHPAASFEQMLAKTQSCDECIIFWENRALSPPEDRWGTGSKIIGSLAVVIGPEGGFTDQEIAQAEAAGFTTASLGPRILKADTAAVSACSLAQYRFGDMGQNYS